MDPKSFSRNGYTVVYRMAKPNVVEQKTGILQPEHPIQNVANQEMKSLLNRVMKK